MPNLNFADTIKSGYIQELKQLCYPLEIEIEIEIEIGNIQCYEQVIPTHDQTLFQSPMAITST
jgi:hypothetical protein